MASHASSGSRTSRRIFLVLLTLSLVGMMGTHSCPNPFGLDLQGRIELKQAGLNQYQGLFTPVLSEDIGGGWTRHTFDTEGGDGPTCIGGTPYTTFTKPGDPEKLLIFLQGGGACWQDFYACNPITDQLPPPLTPNAAGIWVDSFDTGTQIADNPIADYSVVYVPYCDGSVFSGDNDVSDPAFQEPYENFLGLPPGTGPTVRQHRGLRNLTAAMDLAKETFPNARKVLLAGASAGGVGVSASGTGLFRLIFGNFRDLFVFNDSGPVAVNLDDTVGLQARANDWQFGQFFPASCTDCDEFGQPTALIRWGFEHDGNAVGAFFETDFDFVNRFFLKLSTQAEYRALILAEHGAIHDANPVRYRRFIKSGANTHTALQADLFYTTTVNGVPLYQWTAAFLDRDLPGWPDLVEDLIPAP